MSQRGFSCVWVLIFSIGAVFAQEYGIADIRDKKTQIPAQTAPVLDYWMRDTWVTAGPDGYYYLTGTTAAPGRKFAGQPHCWDWNDGIYLWRSTDLKNWESMGPVWTFDKDAIWQKEPWMDRIRNPGRSVNGDPLDNNDEVQAMNRLYNFCGDYRRLSPQKMRRIGGVLGLCSV